MKGSRITLGCMSFGDPSRGNNQWTLDDEQAEPIFREAVEPGITFWDTANAYGQAASEETVGRAIRKYTRREAIVLATKVFFKVGDGRGGAGLSRRAIMEQVDASLARPGTDYIDLYQIHRLDPGTPVEETMEALHDVVKAELWRGFVARLAEMSDTADPRDRKVLEDCSVWDTAPGPAPGRPGSLNVWSDVCRPARTSWSLTLVDVLDPRGLRCGTVLPSRPGGPTAVSLTRLTAPAAEDVPLAARVGTFARWLLDQHRRPTSSSLAGRRYRDAGAGRFRSVADIVLL